MFGALTKQSMLAGSEENSFVVWLFRTWRHRFLLKWSWSCQPIKLIWKHTFRSLDVLGLKVASVLWVLATPHHHPPFLFFHSCFLYIGMPHYYIPWNVLLGFKVLTVALCYNCMLLVECPKAHWSRCYTSFHRWPWWLPQVIPCTNIGPSYETFSFSFRVRKLLTLFKIMTLFHELSYCNFFFLILLQCFW